MPFRSIFPSMHRQIKYLLQSDIPYGRWIKPYSLGFLAILLSANILAHDYFIDNAEDIRDTAFRIYNSCLVSTTSDAIRRDFAQHPSIKNALQKNVDQGLSDMKHFEKLSMGWSERVNRLKNSKSVSSIAIVLFSLISWLHDRKYFVVTRVIFLIAIIILAAFSGWLHLQNFLNPLPALPDVIPPSALPK
jgi:hypothetical protein